MTVPTWTPEQKYGCGVLFIAGCVLYALPLSVWLWKLALGMCGR